LAPPVDVVYQSVADPRNRLAPKLLNGETRPKGEADSPRVTPKEKVELPLRKVFIPGAEPLLEGEVRLSTF
jgi:hypothetical protein